MTDSVIPVTPDTNTTFYHHHHSDNGGHVNNSFNNNSTSAAAAANVDDDENDVVDPREVQEDVEIANIGQAVQQRQRSRAASEALIQPVRRKVKRRELIKRLRCSRKRALEQQQLQSNATVVENGDYNTTNAEVQSTPSNNSLSNYTFPPEQQLQPQQQQQEQQPNTTTTTTTAEENTPPLHNAKRKSLRRREQRKKLVRPILISLSPKWTVVKAKSGMQQDLLSVERDFLAWIRTGLTIGALGIALVQLLPNIQRKYLLQITGVVLVVFGSFNFLYSWIRHMYQLVRLEQNRYVLDTLAPLIFLLFGVCAAVLGYLLVFLG